jgi:hypothetical protein
MVLTCVITLRSFRLTVDTVGIHQLYTVYGRKIILGQGSSGLPICTHQRDEGQDYENTFDPILAKFSYANEDPSTGNRYDTSNSSHCF